MSPLYKYKCPECGCVRTELREIEERNDPIECPDGCMYYAKLQIIPHKNGGIKKETVYAPVSMTLITGTKEETREQ